MTTSDAYWHPFADMAAVSGHELVIVRGEGAHVFDDAGTRYLDAVAGLWYLHVGHGRREIVDAVVAQMRELESFPSFGDQANPRAIELCERLAGLGPMQDAKVLLGLGGGDGIDAAAKLARQYWAALGRPERTHLISRAYGYHGTHGFGTSLSGVAPIRDGNGPLVGSVSHVAHDSAQALEDEIVRLGADRVAAFFCEPLIGAGGVRPAPEGYVEAVGDICERHGVLLVIDSVIGAFGRLGTWLGYERWAVRPDMVVLAKGLTSGYLPLGAVLVAGRVAEPFWAAPGGPMFRHGATYAGHPTCCAAALANLDLLERDGLIPRGRELEGPLMDALTGLGDHALVGEIRGGLGLAAAVDLGADVLARDPAAVGRLYRATREAGVLVRPQATGVAVGPPLIVGEEHLEQIADAIHAGLEAVAAA